MSSNTIETGPLFPKGGFVRSGTAIRLPAQLHRLRAISRACAEAAAGALVGAVIGAIIGLLLCPGTGALGVVVASAISALGGIAAVLF